MTDAPKKRGSCLLRAVRGPGLGREHRAVGERRRHGLPLFQGGTPTSLFLRRLGQYDRPVGAMTVVEGC